MAQKRLFHPASVLMEAGANMACPEQVIAWP